MAEKHPPTDCASIVEAIRSGNASCVETTQYFLDRIADVDPLIASVLCVNPDALAIAAAVDGNSPQGILQGAPLLVKDNIDTGDAMLTTAGSPALAKAPSPSDAFLVKRLRDAGAVILGKTNLSEWANIRSTHSSSGWSTLGGQTRNPHVLDRTPSGSSSGSAAAVAAELCAGAIGTETNGSIISPASACGVVGFKPSVGVVSRTGIVPISHTQDTAGPITRTVFDAALIMDAIAGSDPEDASTLLGKPPTTFAQHLNSDSLNGVRVGLYTDQVSSYNDLSPIMVDIERWLNDAGAIVVPVPTPAASNEFWAAEKTVMLVELVHNMKAYLSRRGDTTDMKSLADIVAYNNRHAAQTMKWFGQEMFEAALVLAAGPEEVYTEALATALRVSGPEGLDKTFDAHDVDVIAALSGNPAAVIDPINGEGGRGVGVGAWSAVSGYPHLTVPAGAIHGLPVGASFMGRKYSDAQVLSWGHAFEQVSKARVQPKFLRTLE